VTKRANGTLTRREKIIYRTATGIIYAVMVFSIVNFIFNDHFPFPNGPEGAFVIWACPGGSRRSSRWPRYWESWRCHCERPRQGQGVCLLWFRITLMSASIAHFARGDARLSILFVLDPLVFLGILMVSYSYFEKEPSGSYLSDPSNAAIPRAPRSPVPRQRLSNGGLQRAARRPVASAMSMSAMSSPRWP